MSLKPSLYSKTQEDLQNFLSSEQMADSLAPLILQNIYKRKKIKNQLSGKLSTALNDQFSTELPEIAQVLKSEDGTIKFLMKFKDDQTVETVLIPFHKKFTVCLSTQVGCAMKCSFCFTGTQGLKRHLNPEEIIGQYMVAWNYLRDIFPEHTFTPNIVFMGQGEPLHNADAVRKAIEIFIEPFGLGIGPKQITLSTAGHLPGLKKFAQFPKVNLALSLHSPFNEVRKKLIPINDHWPLEDLFAELAEVQKGLKPGQFITFEYLLIKNLNDRVEDADELKRLLSPLKAVINIIPFNPFPGSSYERPTKEDVDVFKSLLVARKLHTLVRTTKGSDILAACGQLTSKT